MRWLLLLYTVPASPSRKRAAVWREVKRLGAVYLRDGVCALPQTSEAETDLAALAERIREMDGEATLARETLLEPAAETSIVEQMKAVRDEDYRGVLHEAQTFLRYLGNEAERRDLSLRDLQDLAADLRKLEGWYRQVRARDYFRDTPPERVEAAIRACYDGIEQVRTEVAP